MTPNTIYEGDCIETMKQWDAGCVQTCITSPPYYGLRDYGHEGQIGLEETPEAFVAKMVEVFREVKRVLRDDGTLWLNLGDSYASAWSSGRRNVIGNGSRTNRIDRVAGTSLKEKDLIGIPWMVAFALRADGWYLRQDIIWHKPNPMPESVTDRCTKAHEYIFLFSKSQKYHYDADSVREPHKRLWDETNGGNMADVGHKKSGKIETKNTHPNGYPMPNEKGANKRSVWTVTTKPYSGAHFATFPPELIEPCILAGAPEGGIVLDPFMGSGTTAHTALRAGRQYVGCELNGEYIKLASKRLSQGFLL
jgi:DNA modification methylase